MIAVLFAVAIAGPVAAQADVGVTVTIRSDEDKAMLAGAQVEVMGTRRIATAGGDGVARLRVPPGPALIEVRKMGYRTERFSLNLPETDTIGIDVDLLVAPIRLRGLEATATQTEVALRDNGFYDRQASGMGTFLTGRDIARHPAARLTDAFRRVPGVRVIRYLPQMGRSAGERSAMDVDAQFRLASSRGNATLAGPRTCWMDVYLDDVPVSIDPEGGLSLDAISVSEVIAVEVYNGASETPGKYRRTTNGCGAVVIWTKRGRRS